MAAMATVKPSTLTYLIQRHLLRHAIPKSPVCLFRRSFSLLIRKPNQDRRFPSFLSISSSLPLQCPQISPSSLLVSKYLSSACQDGDEQDKDNGSGRSCEEAMTESSPMKEKKKIASYAHSLGDKLKCQLVGKSGVTDSLVSSVIETLEKNELLKVKIHRTCPGTLEDMILRLEEATGSVAIGKIGRTVILYRPSPTNFDIKGGVS